MSKPVESIFLFAHEELMKLRREFNYLHVGVVQIALKPPFRLGLDTPILAILGDKRHEREIFSDSLLGIVESI